MSKKNAVVGADSSLVPGAPQRAQKHCCEEDKRRDEHPQEENQEAAELVAEVARKAAIDLGGSMLPVMTYEERLARSETKKTLMLAFLAGGEVFSTIPILARVACCSTSTAERTLKQLEKEVAIKREAHFVEGRKINIFGITSHGLAMTDEFEAPAFSLGRTSSNFISHHIRTQVAHLAAEAAGFTNWVPGKLLYKTGLLKVPDALVTFPDGKTIVAIEVENHCKSSKRLQQILGQYLQDIAQGHMREVHYLCPGRLVGRIEKAFGSVEAVKIKGDTVRLEQKHRERFKFYDLEKWPGYQFFLE